MSWKIGYTFYLIFYDLERGKWLIMKFMHTADIHFDSPFATLAGKGKFAQERRLEQRKVMKEMVL